jgi:hypothetical protein
VVVWFFECLPLGERHTIGPRNLRRAIKKTVADASHEDVLLDPLERIARRYAGLIIEDAQCRWSARELEE